jgi:chemotaxis protein CheY-P-specific phosphatase CheC
VANIGARTRPPPFSQMTGRKIMISVPEVSVRRLEEVVAGGVLRTP